MSPDELSEVLARHDAFELTGDDVHPNDAKQMHADRGHLIEEVERLQSNFEEVIYDLQDFLNHFARTIPPDVTGRIRSITTKARGLR